MVLRAQREDPAQGFVVAQNRDGAQAEIGRVHGAQRGQPQRAVRLDPLDEHGQFIEMGQNPGGCGARLRPLDQGDEVTGGIGRKFVDEVLQLPAADLANLVLLTARAIGRQELL